MLGCPTVSLVVAPMYNKIRNFNIIGDFLSPLNMKSSLISYILFSLGFLFMIAGVSLGNVSEVTIESIFATLVLPFLAMSTSLIHWFSNSAVISIWLTKFITKCNDIHVSNNLLEMIGRAREVLLIYRNLEQTLEFFFAYCFTIFQLSWIIVLYLGVSAYFNANYSVQYPAIYGVGSLITALGGENHSLTLSIYVKFNQLLCGSEQCPPSQRMPSWQSRTL